MPNLYEVLNVTPEARAEDIKQAAEFLAIEWDPTEVRDRQTRAIAASILHEIVAARDVLMDPATRRQYDATIGVESRPRSPSTSNTNKEFVTSLSLASEIELKDGEGEVKSEQRDKSNPQPAEVKTTSDHLQEEPDDSNEKIKLGKLYPVRPPSWKFKPKNKRGNVRHNTPGDDTVQNPKSVVPEPKPETSFSNAKSDEEDRKHLPGSNKLPNVKQHSQDDQPLQSEIPGQNLVTDLKPQSDSDKDVKICTAHKSKDVAETIASPLEHPVTKPNYKNNPNNQKNTSVTENFTNEKLSQTSNVQNVSHTKEVQNIMSDMVSSTESNVVRAKSPGPEARKDVLQPLWNSVSVSCKSSGSETTTVYMYGMNGQESIQVYVDGIQRVEVCDGNCKSGGGERPYLPHPNRLFVTTRIEIKGSEIRTVRICDGTLETISILKDGVLLCKSTNSEAVGHDE